MFHAVQIKAILLPRTCSRIFIAPASAAAPAASTSVLVFSIITAVAESISSSDTSTKSSSRRRLLRLHADDPDRGVDGFGGDGGPGCTRAAPDGDEDHVDVRLLEEKLE